MGTALETCGYVPFEAFQKAAPFCQLIFFDLKCMASEVHRRYTGVDNRRILDNLMALSRELPDCPSGCAPSDPRRQRRPGTVVRNRAVPAEAPIAGRLPAAPLSQLGGGKIPPAGPELSTAGLEPPDRGAVRRLNDELRAELGLRPGQE